MWATIHSPSTHIKLNHVFPNSSCFSRQKSSRDVELLKSLRSVVVLLTKKLGLVDWPGGGGEGHIGVGRLPIMVSTRS